MDNAGSTEIVIASLALVGTCIAAIIWALKYFAKSLSTDIVAHTKAANAQVQTNKEVTRVMRQNLEVNDQMLTFMKNLNGKLAKATVDTLRETKEVIKEAKK